MEPVTTTIAIVTAITAAISVAQHMKIKKKNEEIDSLLRSLTQYSSSYAFEPCDKLLIRDCQQYLKVFLGNRTFAQILQDKTIDEKKKITQQLVVELSKRLKVNISAINIQQLSGGTLGSEVVDDEGNIILYLNEAMYDVDPERLIHVMLHELRHAVQDSSLRNDIWGFSDERKAQWLIGAQQYVQADSDAKFGAYSLQILEVDANAFADAVFK
jgi:hypothetical protein